MSKLKIILGFFVIFASFNAYSQQVPTWLLPFWTGTASISGVPNGQNSNQVDVFVHLPYTPAQIDEAIKAINQLNVTLGQSNELLQQYMPIIEQLNSELNTSNANWKQTNALLQDYLKTFNQFVEPANLFKSGFALGAGLAAGNLAVQLVVQVLEQGSQLLYQALSGELQRKQDQELFNQFVKLKEFYEKTKVHYQEAFEVLKTLNNFYQSVGPIDYSNQNLLLLVRLQARYVSTQIELNTEEEKSLVKSGAGFQDSSTVSKKILEMEDYLATLQNVESNLKSVQSIELNCGVINTIQNNLLVLNKDLNQSRLLMLSLGDSVISYLTEQYRGQQERMVQLANGDYVKKQKEAYTNSLNEVVRKSKENIQRNKDLFAKQCNDTLKLPFFSQSSACQDLFDQWFSLYRNYGKYIEGTITNDEEIGYKIKSTIPEFNRKNCFILPFAQDCFNNDLLQNLKQLISSNTAVGYPRNAYLIERDMTYSKIAIYQSIELLEKSDTEQIRQTYQVKSLEFAQSLKSVQLFLEDLKIGLRLSSKKIISCP